MKDLKPKFELVEGQDFTKLWEEKAPLREQICEYLQKELDYEYGKLGLKLQEEEKERVDAIKRLKALDKKARKTLAKLRKVC
jgi:hypothetical protein